MFLYSVKLKNTNAEAITETTLIQLKRRHLRVSLKYLVSCLFDGAATYSGDISGVQRRISAAAEHEMPHIHCWAHMLPLALTIARNKYP